jgi:uncharacterized protein (TIGR03435 family)
MIAIQFLAEWELRSSALILSGALLLSALRVKDPSIRLAAWTAMLCGSLAIPPLAALAPTMAVPAIHRAPQSAAAPAPVYAVAAGPGSEAPPRQTGVSERFDWASAAVASYVLVALALLLRLCVGIGLGLRLLRGSRATGQTTEEIQIRESDRVASPVALGILRPVIVLPADWRQWDAAKLDAVLAHERSHIRRRDPAVQLLSAVHRALLWHSPLSWFLHRRIVRIAEEVSDDAAVAAIRNRASYAEVLLDFMRRGVRRASWQGVPMARYGAPAERIQRILDGTALSRGVTRWTIAAILALGAPLAYMVAAVQAAAPQQGSAESTAGKPLTFDAASVKPAIVPDGVTVAGGSITAPRGSGITIPRNTGGPGTNDPGRIHYPLISLKDLLRRAYASYYEIDAPSWMDDDLVQVDATMPAATTNEQFQEMLRNLIANRFDLKYHTAAKQITAYALMVAKSGPKMKESVEGPVPQREDANDAPASPQPRKIGPDGFTVLPPVDGPALRFQGERANRARMVGQQQTMQDLAHALKFMLKSAVTDETGITARYDFTVTFAGGLGGALLAPPPSSAGGELLPDIFTALQSQLGLKLEPKKVAVEVFVVDRMEKTPTGN